MVGLVATVGEEWRPDGERSCRSHAEEPNNAIPKRTPVHLTIFTPATIRCRMLHRKELMSAFHHCGHHPLRAPSPRDMPAPDLIAEARWPPPPQPPPA